MSRRMPWTITLLVASLATVCVPRPLRAEDPAPPAPPAPRANEPAPNTMPPALAAESRVMLSILKATGRVMLRYLEEKKDPEKAAVYEEALRAFGGVLSRLDPRDERAAVAAGMEAVVELMPKVHGEKQTQVMREIVATFAAAFAEGMRDDAPPAAPGTAPVAPAPGADLGEALLGGLADFALGEVTAREFGGAQLCAIGPGRPGFPVVLVKAASRAERIGLRAGDVIVRFADHPATWRSLLGAAQSLHETGEFPPMTVLRAGQSVVLGAAPK